jgi:PBP1b-binding outer membrane lipoprotein LpoB
MKVFMRKKYKRFAFVIIVFFVFAGCHKKENAATEENIENGLAQTGDAVGHTITDFFYEAT